MAKGKKKLKVWHIVVISIIVLGGLFIFQLMTIDTSTVESQNGCQAGLICFYQFDPIRSSIMVIDNNDEWIVVGDCITTDGELFGKAIAENPELSFAPPADFDQCQDRINFNKFSWTRNFNIINIVGIEVEQHQFFLIEDDTAVPILPEMNIIGG